MVEIDEQEEKIVRQLIRNPRVSDSKIAKNEGIPVMTVNRKRKRLEERGLVSYYTDFCHGEKGIQDFLTKDLFIIKFKSEVTRKKYLEFMENDKKYKSFMAMYVDQAFLGEKDGRLSLIVIMNGKNTAELLEVFNEKLLKYLKNEFDEGRIIDIQTVRLTDLVRTHHNYLPKVNIEKGVIKKDWPDEWIFVNRKSHESLLKGSK